MATHVQPDELPTSSGSIHPCKSQGETSHNTAITYTSFDYANGDEYSRSTHCSDDSSSSSGSPSAHLSEVVLMMEREMMELSKNVVDEGNGRINASSSSNKSLFVSTYDDGLSGELTRLAAAQECLRAEIDMATKTTMGWLSSSSSGESLLNEFEATPSLADTNSTIASSRSSDDGGSHISAGPSSSLHVKCGSYDRRVLHPSLSFDGDELKLSPTDSEKSKHRFELFAISDNEEDDSVNGNILRTGSSRSGEDLESSSSCSYDSSENDFSDKENDARGRGSDPMTPVYSDNSGLHCAEGGVLDIMSRLMLVSVWNNKSKRKKAAR